ncbi:DUF2924 domain-containing protein [Maioricimonas rarisocia]
MAAEVAAMERLTATQLQEKYAEIFGERPRSCHRRWLIRRIAWRLQARAEGDLSERAQRRATELADDADVRVTPPKTVVLRLRDQRIGDTAPTDPRIPAPGTWLTKTYKGALVEVQVLANGFEFAGEKYKSLTGVARAVTGTHCNGFRFFGLGGRS